VASTDSIIAKATGKFGSAAVLDFLWELDRKTDYSVARTFEDRTQSYLEWLRQRLDLASDSEGSTIRRRTNLAEFFLAESGVGQDTILTLFNKISGVSIPATESHQIQQARVTPKDRNGKSL